MPTRCRPLALWIVLLAASTAHADSGELTVSATFDQECAWLRHPYHDLAGHAPSFHLYVPRFGGTLLYGLHNRVALGLAGRASLRRSTWAPVAGYQHFDSVPHTDFFVFTRDALATALLRVTAIDGNFWFFDVGLEGGLSWRKWRATRYRTAEEAPMPLASPADASMRRGHWQQAPYLRASATLRARPWQYLSFSITPYVSTTFDKDLAAGAAIDFGVPVGVGPGF